MNDRQQFAARVQAILSFLLLGAVALLALLLLGIIAYQTIKQVALDQTLTSLLNTVSNALINMGAIGVGFWLARHRPQQADGSDDSPEVSTRPADPAPSAIADVNPTQTGSAPAGAQK